MTRENNFKRMVLDRYELLEPIGKGGFSTVYRARDHKMSRDVAIKVVRRTDDLSGRATREARTAAQLSHAHIVTVFELAEDEHEVFIVSELVEGPTLARCIARSFLSDRDYIDITIQILSALEHAHDKGIIHRDIKPDNIILTEDDPPRAKVTDFGIAQLENAQRLTRQGDVLGTLAYMSPEQAGGHNVDGGTDVYSAALTLYECLAGANPLRGETAGETVGRIQAGAPPLSEARPDLPRELSDLLEDAMEPDSGLRIGARSFAAGLEQLLPAFSAGDQPTAVLKRSELHHPERLARSAQRYAELASRLANAAIALLVAWTATFGSSLYPAPWRLPLMLAAAAGVALLPRVGLVALAGVALLPVAAFSPALGVLATIVTVLYLAGFALIKPRIALLPALAPGLALIGLGLVFPALAGATARLRGLASAFIGAVALTLFQLFSGAGTLAYLGINNNFDLATRLSGEYNPLAAITALLKPLEAAPALALQPVIWLAAALPAALLIRRRHRLLDWTGLALANGVLATGYLLLPYLLPDHPLPMSPFLKTFLLCAIIQCGLLLISPRAENQQMTSPRERT